MYSKDSLRHFKGSLRHSKGSLRHSKGSLRKSKGFLRHSKGSLSKSKGSLRHTKAVMYISVKSTQDECEVNDERQNYILKENKQWVFTLKLNFSCI